MSRAISFRTHIGIRTAIIGTMMIRYRGCYWKWRISPTTRHCMQTARVIFGTHSQSLDLSKPTIHVVASPVGNVHAIACAGLLDFGRTMLIDYMLFPPTIVIPSSRTSWTKVPGNALSPTLALTPDRLLSLLPFMYHCV